MSYKKILIVIFGSVLFAHGVYAQKKPSIQESFFEYTGKNKVVIDTILPALEKELMACRKDFDCPILLGERKIKVRYFDTFESYARAGGLTTTPFCFHPETKELLIDGENSPGHSLDRVIPHEVAHIVMCKKRERVGVGRLPTVFEEGVAITREGDAYIAESVFSSLIPRFIPQQAKDLAFNPQKIWTEDTGPSGVTYRQSGSMMAFLMTRDISRNDLFVFGMDLARLNAAGKQRQASDSIRLFLGRLGFKDNNDLQKQWTAWELQYARDHAKEWGVFKATVLKQIKDYQDSLRDLPMSPEKKSALQEIAEMKNAIDQIDKRIKK